MQCYTELLPPTGVTNALAIPFLSSTARNLIVVRSSVLQIFTLLGPPSESSESKLILEKEYQLPGTVTDLSRVKILNSKSGGEAILLAVRNAKLSLIEWDPERYSISTVSIHYYERDDLSRSPWVPDLGSCGSTLSVDPSSRCAVFNFGVRNLAILPFHQAGDDLVMDDYDSALDEKRPDKSSQGEAQTGKPKDEQSHITPYASSFVLPLTALEPSLLHPVSLEFLYEYREPTFGILYSQIATSNSLLHERKDIMFYSVFTLDLEQRAYTTLLSVSRLPSDLFKVLALPPPVGGALLIGSNEIVHVDQAGKTTAVGVNDFSRQVSAFSMSDQSDLSFRLEGCVVERLGGDSGDLLLVLKSGDVALIKFKLDGRSVSGMTVHSLKDQVVSDNLKSAASCSACFNDGHLFIGSEDGDSVLMRWTHFVSGKRIRAEQNQGVNDSEELSESEQIDDDGYEDDLYSSAPDQIRIGSRPNPGNSTPEFYHFQLSDKLSSIGPLRDITLGRAMSQRNPHGHLSEHNPHGELELVASQGSGRAGGLVVIKREIDALSTMSFKVEGADSVWSAKLNQREGEISPKEPEGKDSSIQYLIVSRPSENNKEMSEVFTVERSGIKACKAPDFNPNEDSTVDIATLAKGTRLVQVLQTEVRSYDKDLGLAQIYPVWDEDTEEERTVRSVSFADPYIAIIRDDSSLLLLQTDESGDLDEAEDLTILLLLDHESNLLIFSVPDLKLLWTINGVDCLQPVLSVEPPRRSNTRESLQEVIIADLGDESFISPFLIVRTRNDDLVVYKPVLNLSEADNERTLRLLFFREANHTLSNISSESSTNGTLGSRQGSLRVLPNVSGLSTVLVPGRSAKFLVKTSQSSPHTVHLRGESTRWLSKYHAPAASCENSFVHVDYENNVQICQFPPGIQLHHSWPLQKVPLDEQVDFLTYSTAFETYVLGTSTVVEFKLPEDDELHPEWRGESTEFLPEVPQSSIKVISPQNWAIIDSYPLEPAEHVTAVKNVNLEVSENTHERKDLIVVGTSIAKGEDIPARGGIYVFEVIEVVPDPDRPETGRKLKLIGKETVKGAVTALSGIGGQGFVIVAQGQKCMVRGLKEDGSLLPVAFMDMQCYVNVVKELKGTGMCILGDAVKGLWFAGYSEEPYKMTLFGKDPEYLEVVAADFLPDGNKLYILVADSDCNLHVLQYDPEDPKSSNGDRLLNRSKFYTGNYASAVTLLPRTAVSSEVLETGDDSMDVDHTVSTHQVLIASHNGSLALVTGVAEESYRRLSALQSQLTNTIDHPGGLNPRAFRAVERKQRQSEIAGRVGATEWQIRADLEAIGGDGLGYL
ncbi:hypothetical protein N7470_009118 [Penicillium chermesinum]|nr:hypothetical protein N7470_009118 [Penicillium chermesinum]